MEAEDLEASVECSSTFRERYRLTRRLGAGASGTVYEAVQVTLNRRVAVKFLQGCWVSDSEQRQRFVREARTLSRLHHPSLVELLDADVAADWPYLVTEFIGGPSLAAVVARRGRLPTEEALALFRKVLDGVEYLHGQGFLHRDIKPANILLRPQGGVAVVDFGLAFAVDESLRLTTPGFQVGTPVYLAPEIYLGMKASAASDLYSSGLILLEMLSGQVPYVETAGDSLLGVKMQGLTPELSSSLGPQPRFVVDLLTRLLNPDPGFRPRSAAEVLEAIAPRPGPPPVRRPVAAPAPPPPGQIQRERSPAELPAPASDASARQATAALWGAASAGLVLAVAAGVWSWRATTVTTAARPPAPAPAPRAASQAVAAKPSPLALSPERRRELQATVLAVAQAAELTLDAIGKHVYRRTLAPGGASGARDLAQRELGEAGLPLVLDGVRKAAPALLSEPWPDPAARARATTGLLRLALLDRLFQILGLGLETGARGLLGPRDFRVERVARPPGTAREIDFPLAAPAELLPPFSTLGRDLTFVGPAAATSRVESQGRLPSLQGTSRAELAVLLDNLGATGYADVELRWTTGQLLAIPVTADNLPSGRQTWLVQSFDPGLLAAGPVLVTVRHRLLPGSPGFATLKVFRVALRLR